MKILQDQNQKTRPGAGRSGTIGPGRSYPKGNKSRAARSSTGNRIAPKSIAQVMPNKELPPPPITLIGRLPAGRRLTGSADRLPATDDRARIQPMPLDGEVSGAIRVDAVCSVSLDKRSGKCMPEFRGGFHAARQMEWTIMLTDGRILFWSPCTIDLKNTKKIEDDRATGGHIKYQWIKEIIISNDVSPAALSISADTDAGGTSKTICLVTDDSETLAFIMKKLVWKVWESNTQLKSIEKIRMKKNAERIALFDWKGGKGTMIFSLPHNALWISGNQRPQKKTKQDKKTG